MLYILKTKYYFSLSKFYRVLKAYESQMKKIPKELNEKKLSEENEEVLNNLNKRIYVFYKGFIHESCDNSLILMSFYIFKDLCKAPLQYGLTNFELFYEAVINIYNNCNLITSVTHYITNLFEYNMYVLSY